MGDVIHALPVASALRAAEPASTIHWLVDERWAPLLEKNPAVNRVVLFPRERFRGVVGWWDAAVWLRGLRRLAPDVCLDIQGLLRSGLMARASRARLRIGLSDAREGARLFCHRLARVLPGEHSVRRYLRILEPLGIAPPAIPEFPLPQGELPPETPQTPFVLIHPFARGEGKSLDPESLRLLCAALAPWPVVLVGGAAPGVVRVVGTWPVINLLGKTSLPRLIGLIRAAACVVSVDSGPAHLAAAVGTPLLAIHTWSDPIRVGPFSESAWIWRGGTIHQQNLAAGRPSQAPSRSVPSVLPTPEDLQAIASHVRACLTSSPGRG